MGPHECHYKSSSWKLHRGKGEGFGCQVVLCLVAYSEVSICQILYKTPEKLRRLHLIPVR